MREEEEEEEGWERRGCANEQSGRGKGSGVNIKFTGGRQEDGGYSQRRGRGGSESYTVHQPIHPPSVSQLHVLIALTETDCLLFH